MSEESTNDGADVESGTGEGAGAQAPSAQPAATAASSGSLLSGNHDAARADAPAQSAAGAASPEAAEDYELTAPAGMYTAEQLSAAKVQFKELGLDKDAAQKLMDTAAANQQQVMQQHQQQVSKWADEVRMDKEMGGPALEATLMEAKSALGKFDGDGKVIGMLEETGYSNHPEVIRFLSRIGKAMGEDGVVTGKTTGNEKPLWERLYPNSK